MPAQPAWFQRLEEILSALRAMTSSHLDRAAVEKLFRVRQRRARQITVRSPRNDFQRCGDLRRTPATRGAVRGELCGSSLLVDAGPSPLVVLLNEGLLRDVKGSAPKPAPLAVRQLPERCDCVFCPEVLTESRIAQEP